MIDVIEDNVGVRVVYTSDAGESKSAVVVGMSKSEVEDKKQEIVDTHSLDQF